MYSNEKFDGKQPVFWGNERELKGEAIRFGGTLANFYFTSRRLRKSPDIGF